MQAETEPYSGVLFIDREELGRLGGGSGPALWDARLDRDTLVLVWQGGKETTLPWPPLRDRLGLGHLPGPALAFITDPDTVGLLFTASTPRPGLQHREPHSVIHPIGWVTAAGLQAARA